MKIVVRSILGIWCLFLWLWKMLISSDVPVSISDKELKSTILLLIVTTIICLLYVKLTVDSKLLYFLLLPAILWGVSMQQAFVYHYHAYDTLLSILGFITLFLVMAYSGFQIRKRSH